MSINDTWDVFTAPATSFDLVPNSIVKRKDPLQRSCHICFWRPLRFLDQLMIKVRKRDMNARDAQPKFVDTYLRRPDRLPLVAH